MSQTFGYNAGLEQFNNRLLRADLEEVLCSHECFILESLARLDQWAGGNYRGDPMEVANELNLRLIDCEDEVKDMVSFHLSEGAKHEGEHFDNPPTITMSELSGYVLSIQVDYSQSPYNRILAAQQFAGSALAA